jgi:hypothetical protein
VDYEPAFGQALQNDGVEPLQFLAVGHLQMVVAAGDRGVGAEQVDDLVGEVAREVASIPSVGLRLQDLLDRSDRIASRRSGCCSSREYAPWALLDHAFKAVINAPIASLFGNHALHDAEGRRGHGGV